MVVAYSPHRNGGGGGTLHFPSPTNIRHAEPNSAIAQLRHSLSRSPSKGPAFRLVTSKSASPSPRSPLSPQKLTDCLNLLPSTNRTLQSPFTTPYARNARRNRFGVRKLSPVSPSARSAQRAPVKRALSESTQNGNATPPSPSSSCARLENCSSSSVTPEAPGTPLSKKENADAGKADNLLAPQHTFHRRDNGSAYLADLAAKSSPLKRGDGIMNYDLTNLGSPSAKRRSLHGASFGADFNIFDAETVALGEDIMDVRMERSVSETPPATDHAAFSSSIMPKRTSSLRKTTLQQRYEKPSFARGKPVLDQASMTDALTQDVSKARQRLSLDHVFPQISRDSPFSSPGNLPNASVHPLLHPRKEFFQQPLQRHPLSRTMTQSSSSSSLVETDDSPTHAPAQPSDFRRSHVDFTKSVAVVPPWAAHPNPISRATTQISSNIENSFATPEKYKLAKPLPAAFMSTGLISKRNKDMIKDRNFKASTATMPDTPCKRHISMAPMNYTTTPGSIVKPRVKHQSVHSFGTPSTPFNPHANQPPLGASVKGAGIFGSSYRGNGRRESFASVDGDENFQSPSDKVNSQLSNEFDVPPTPTKQITGPGVCQASTNLNEGGSSSSLEGADSGSFGSFGTMSPQRNQHCKSNFNCFSSPTADEDGDSVMEESSSTTLRFRSLAAISSFSSRSHLLAHPRSPASLSRKPISLPFVLTRNAKTKPSPLSPASPVPDRNEHKSPHTPHTPQQVGILPPDPSGLSISVYGHGVAAPGSNPAGTKKVALPPSTPTASRDSLSQFGNSRLSMTPNQIHGPVDVDSCLISRFDKVDLIGSGEFSQVFRVSRPSTHVPPDYFSTIASPASGETEKRKLVWAVKKSRFPYIGPKDRARKLQEVEVLSALGRGDHTLHLVESWENRRHLYIQTEYCEEGSLDEFLTRMGKAARLDDFRIWKIMLELASGIQHVHDSGFIHLDLKPANVLITYEGVLKIADFGLASSWPVPAGIDGEGDREYIGPEILMGRYDKPADIFALGLILLEIAANVMLPDNGASWQRLRNGDMSDVPSLSWSSDAGYVLRDSTGMPIDKEEESLDSDRKSNIGGDGFSSPESTNHIRHEGVNGNLPANMLRIGELITPPTFMADADHEDALDKLVRWMISPQPGDRPTVSQLLSTRGLEWTKSRRRAGATIYEGTWGPSDTLVPQDTKTQGHDASPADGTCPPDQILPDDAEMLDV